MYESNSKIGRRSCKSLPFGLASGTSTRYSTDSLQAAERMDIANSQCQTKDSELTKLQQSLAGKWALPFYIEAVPGNLPMLAETLAKIEAAQAAFKDETNQLSTELAAMGCKKDTLDEQVAELRARHKQKEADLRNALVSHERQQERNQKMIDRVSRLYGLCATYPR